MSGTTLRMLISFGGILAVVWAVQHVANVEKEQLLLPKMRIRHTEKVRGPLSTEVTLVGSANTSSQQALVLQGTVTTTKAVTNAKIKWVLPSGVILVSGSLEDTIPSISPEKPYQTQITIQQNDLSNQQIHFIVSGAQPGIHFSSVSQYNTTDEEFLQQQKDLVIKTLNADKSSQKKAGHVFH